MAGAFNRLRFRILEHKRALLDIHRKAWNGVSVLVFRDDSALTPRKHRINFYVLIFFGLLFVTIPTAALGLYVERRIRQGSDPMEQVENRLILLKTLATVTREKGSLLKRTSEQVGAYQTITNPGERALLDRYAEQKYARFLREEQPGDDVISRQLTEIQNTRVIARVLQDTATMALSTVWNRMYVHHLMPRRSPLAPGAGRITSFYGRRNDPMAMTALLGGGSSSKEFHRGIDIAARRGLEILATAPGTVIRASTKVTPGHGLGKHVLIHHGLGYMTLYGHCSQLLVAKGQVVKRGQPVARVGRTGRATGHHVHYEVLLGNLVHVNPRPYIELK